MVKINIENEDNQSEGNDPTTCTTTCTTRLLEISGPGWRFGTIMLLIKRYFLLLGLHFIALILWCYFYAEQIRLDKILHKNKWHVEWFLLLLGEIIICGLLYALTMIWLPELIKYLEKNLVERNAQQIQQTELLRELTKWSEPENEKLSKKWNDFKNWLIEDVNLVKLCRILTGAVKVFFLFCISAGIFVRGLYLAVIGILGFGLLIGKLILFERSLKSDPYE